VILASGFYEWRTATPRKIPHYIAPRDGLPMAFAGLWERHEQAATPLETCTIITTAANRALRDLHHRMPVILPPAAVRTWLEPGQPAEVLAALLQPAPDALLTYHPVGFAVNSPANDGAALVAPIGTG
jgi:putative SOS response-associated peptidase YedK